MLAPALRESDTVALVAPAGPLSSEAELLRAAEIVRTLGFVPRIGASANACYGYLAGDDDARAADFNAAAADRDVRGIFALRGGYGTMRILDRLDYGALATDPKVVLGYSDLTAPLNAIAQRTGLVTFHGPFAALSQFTPFELEWLLRAITRSEPIGTLDVPGGQTIAPGRASGRLAGGNLSLVASLVGTPYEIDTAGTILVLEEVDEAPYRIDRMLTQLRLSGALARVSGILVGQCSNCDVDDEHRYAGLRLADVLHDRLGDLRVPVLAGAPVGHIDEQWTLPLGARAILDADARMLTIPESAVR